MMMMILKLLLGGCLVYAWREVLFFSPVLAIAVLIMVWVVCMTRAVGVTKHLHRD